MRELKANNLDKRCRLRSGLPLCLARKCLLGIAVVMVLSYSSACLYFFLKQGTLIYKPTAEWTATPLDVGLPYEPVTIDPVRIHGQSVRLSAWWIPARDARGPAVLYLHGNKGNISDCLWIAKTLYEVGASVLVVDYAGYGKSSPFAISEDSMRESGLAALSYLKSKVPETMPKIVYGRSMGGGVAVEVAADAGASIDGLILESTFTSLPDQVRHLGYGWLPIGLLLRDRYPSLDQLATVGVKRVLMIHGGADTYVPVWMGLHLAQAARGVVTTLIIPGAGHNDVSNVGGASVAQALRAFLSSAR